MNLLLIGPPGAGKGTQCKKLAEKFNLAHLSSGDIFRAELSSDSELGRLAKTYMNQGELVPDEIVIKMMVGAIVNKGYNYLLDGFPRTSPQAQALDKALEGTQKLDAVVVLEVADQIVIDRLSRRRSCPECGSVYDDATLTPVKDGVCDKDGVALIQRPDDNAEVIKNRLKTYHELTQPVIEYYKQSGINLTEIDGSLAVNEVAARVFSYVDSL